MSDPPAEGRVLVVDDETNITELVAMALRYVGFDVATASSGRDAITAVTEFRPDLVVLDVMMPDLDGFEVCELLKRNRETNLIPVLMVTALNDASHRSRGVRVGANDYLTKPFTTEGLFSAIDRALAWRREHTEHGTTGEINFSVRS
jgi:DNA-binding response OmpR family regulator